MGTWMLTGGAGYIGSHVVGVLLAAGEKVVVLDDLSTGDRRRVPAHVPFVHAPVTHAGAVRATLRRHEVTGVIHLAGKKSVGESCEDPDRYYRENVGGLIALIESMREESVRRLVFSSSAAVYGTPQHPTVTETSPTTPESPYGRSKLVGEWAVRDAVAAYGMSAASLRYFNVVGCARPELADVRGSNLFPRILDHLAAGDPLPVFGDDYPTADGTAVRDYIHVQDLAEAHLAAAHLTARPGVDEIFNIGCGRGYSVLEVLHAFSAVRGEAVPYRLAGRRPGDPASMVADATRALTTLGWRPRRGLDEMVRSAWEAASAARTTDLARAV